MSGSATTSIFCRQSCSIRASDQAI
ncbi:hypothetical protein [Erythrobacter sp. KY5]